jgi:hypothetical protein
MGRCLEIKARTVSLVATAVFLGCCALLPLSCSLLEFGAMLLIVGAVEMLFIDEKAKRRGLAFPRSPIRSRARRRARYRSVHHQRATRQWRRQVNRQLNLDSTAELRRASSLRILAAKRGFVSKSIHTHKACWQWLKHVLPRPLFSSQTMPGWLFRVSFEMQSDISRQRRRECARTEFQCPTHQEEKVRHTDQTAYLKLATGERDHPHAAGTWDRSCSLLPAWPGVLGG